MAYLKFGVGTRSCLGYNYANRLMPLLLIKILSKFELQLQDKRLKEEEHYYPTITVFQN